MAMASSSSISASRPRPSLFSPKTLVGQIPATLLPRSIPNPNLTSIAISNSRSSPLPLKYSTSPSELAVATPSVTLKPRLAAGETLYGLFLLSSSPTLAEIAGLAGYDYVVIDVEHGAGGISDALPCIRALAATRTAAIIRVPEPTAALTKKALDLGPQGIMFPSVENPEAAALAVSYCRFPPRGIRGTAHPVVRASGYGIDDGYLSRYEEDLLIMVQVETAAGVSQIEAIAGIEGVDCVQMGPLDLSASMGLLWDPGNKKVRTVLREAEGRVLRMGREDRRGPWLGGFAMPHDGPVELKARGYHMVAGAVDIGMFREAAVEDVLRFRRAEVEIGEEEDDGEKPGDAEYWSE
ncbi:5-keto-4-deoxy-D-glucarate aldolase [Dioscorea cayenensis subsp. rotundata]|uniref:5-keto-4-deoxy-D-glucarate aldolase n=1 Tax=Dioscorea cayennensis subsp. rotundata TaxID=55577 RepID=A0AB40C3V4_DIOCR|nr:5-keto-4-deoxy-D-glucarate aldolase [Dioscorea cayenensis subsp. rotundata]